tara:strand:- start:549 stop:956 length:408 start_codon:yes stop_codon:yes gene_type:complete
MSATVFGNGTYGTADETATTINLYTASVSMDATSNQVFAMDHIGEEQGIAIGNKGANLNFSGILSTTDNLGAAVGDALAAADIANSDIFANSANGVTIFYVVGGNITRNNAGFQEGSLECIGRAGLTDVSATVVS